MLVDRYAPVANGPRHSGDAAAEFARYGGDMANNRIPVDFFGCRRPFIDKNGHPCVVLNSNPNYQYLDRGEKKNEPKKYKIKDLLNQGYNALPLWVWNATSLRKEDWEELDAEVQIATREPLIAWEDLEKANSYGGFDAYGHMTLEYEAMSDSHEAVKDMDGLSAGRTDNPLFVLRSHPLPMTHSDFWYSDRRLVVSGNKGQTLDTQSAEQAGRRVGEMIEDTTIGNIAGVTYGTQSTGIIAHQGASTEWGYQNFTYRGTKTNITAPTGANPHSTVSDILAMITTLNTRKYYGPFNVYFSQPWVQYLGDDYAFNNGSNWAMNPTQTLYSRIKALSIDGSNLIQNVKVLPRWTAPLLSDGSTAGTYAILIVQMTKNVAQAINGQPPTVLQWESQGGARKNFKVWAIQSPRLMAQYNQTTGIMHGTTS